MQSRFARLAQILVVTGILGCSVSGDHSVWIKNASEEEIREVKIDFGTRRTLKSVAIGPGIQRVEVVPTGRIPAVAVVSWVDSSGEEHRERVDLKEVSSKHFSGKLKFAVLQDSVLVEAIP